MGRIPVGDEVEFFSVGGDIVEEAKEFDPLLMAVALGARLR